MLRPLPGFHLGAARSRCGSFARSARALVRCSITLALLGVAAGAIAEDSTPAASNAKYGSIAVRLHRDTTYVKEHAAPDFWALAPYYSSQLTDSSCSVASVVMLVNALRADLELDADEELATHSGLLDKAADAAWKRAVAAGGEGVSLPQLGAMIERSLAAYGLSDHEVRVVHVQAASDAALASIRAVLSENERSSADVVVVNFLQSTLTGDPDGAVGHIAPIGAYDAERHRVLVMDPDRQWYEPYWVPDRALLEAMATLDSQAKGGAGSGRGYVYVRRRAATGPSAP